MLDLSPADPLLRTRPARCVRPGAQFDAFGRRFNLALADIVDPDGKQISKTIYASGLLARSTNHDGCHQSFDYDAFGDVSAGNTLQSRTASHLSGLAKNGPFIARLGGNPGHFANTVSGLVVR